jgi:hypothetical protein
MGEIAIEPDCLIEISNGAVLIALVPIWEAPFVVDGRSCSMNNFTEGVRVRCFRVTATTGSGELTTEITMSKDSAPRKQNYKVKKVEAIAVGTDVQARMFTLAPADVIPWHRHSECMDHYFVLRGALTIETRNPEMALNVEGVVGGCVKGQESLG